MTDEERPECYMAAHVEATRWPFDRFLAFFYVVTAIMALWLFINVGLPIYRLYVWMRKKANSLRR